MAFSIIDFPKDFLNDIKCLLFFVAVVGAVWMLHRDYNQAPAATPAPSKAHKSRKKAK